MNFGPINTDGGWRRLNVLVTRAKWQCIVVSSVRANDLDGVNPNNRGAVSFRAFLEFAERNGELPAETAVATDAETNEFEEAVRAALIDRGLKVDMQVGASRYRIDLAVRDPRNEKRYLLGIECDGLAYHSSRTARDRDLQRQLVLQRMGWRIHRVWSTEWFYNTEQAIASILRSVELAQQAPVAQSVYATPPAESAPPGPEEQSSSAPTQSIPTSARRYKPGVPYFLFTPSRPINRDHLLNAAYAGVLVETISMLVRVEGPVHQDVLIERLKDVHGVARAGSNVQSNITRALQTAERNRAVVSDGDRLFYSSPQICLESFLRRARPSQSEPRRV